MANDSPSSAIQTAYSGAKGALLVYEGKCDQAAPFLERDAENAFSEFRMEYALRDKVTDNPSTMEFNEPTAEQAFLRPWNQESAWQKLGAVPKK
jgi:hypothetical protein